MHTAKTDQPAVEHRGNAELRAAFPLLVSEWQDYWQQQPWHHGSPTHEPDAVLEVLRAILDTAMSDHGGRQVHARLLRAAMAHGHQRRDQGASDELLLGEYHALRTALWRHLLHSASLSQSLTTIFRVDVVMTAASGLALRGYMQKSVPPDFPWERELARAMADISVGLEAALG